MSAVLDILASVALAVLILSPLIVFSAWLLAKIEERLERDEETR